MGDTPAQRWPQILWLVRHGESAGNVALGHAEASGLSVIDIAERDVDVPLSALGERQASALGRWFADRPEDLGPTVIVTSPYRRALQTTAAIVEAAAAAGRPPLVQVVDERLREREFGMLDRLTKAGIIAKFPDQAELRSRVGKFYYRPPGGESWCDVILRLRSVMDQIQLQYREERVLVVAHQVIVLCFRYLLEKMTEAQILALDRQRDVANCSVTSYECGLDDAGRAGMMLRLDNFVAPIEAAGEPVTKEPDPVVAPR